MRDELCTLRFRRGSRRFAKVTAQPGVAVRVPGHGTLEARDRRGRSRRYRF